ncbi:AEC family transporter [Taklimakanibacter deserti]|uniref:AEC family transporter n=1 Tax=Taklimakanibacter deserti TaxID=2267839 RepID=UPI0013C427E6
MSSVLTTILPVFGLIALGFICARTKFIGAAAGQGLSQVVFNLAMPALLFRTVAVIDQQSLSPWPLWSALFGGIAFVWLVTTVIANTTKLIAAAPASAAMGASFGNLAMLGLPLTLAHFGDRAALPVGFVLSIHAPILWLAAVIHIESSGHGHLPSVLTIARQLASQLIRNPIVLALLLGSLWRVTGLGLHPVPDRFLELLGEAGIPTALVALGLSLAAYSLKGQWRGILTLMILKMLLLPLTVWLIARHVVGLEPFWIQIALVLAAMPTGANAYLFAERYATGTAAVSGAIALGTALSLVTLSVLFLFMDSGLI